MGKVTKKEPKVCGLSGRRLRQIVRERTLADYNFLQSQINSSTKLESNDPGISNVHLHSSNVALPSFNDNGLSSNASNLNIDFNSLKNNDTEVSNVLFPSSNTEFPTFADNEPQSSIGDLTIDFNSSSLSTGSYENSRTPCNETQSFTMEDNASDNFILNDDSCDSDTEITTNEDTRRTDSDLGEDDLDIPDYPCDETCMEKNNFATQLRQWALKFHITLVALTALLLLLRVFDVTLPLDARTLLGTLRKTENIEMCGGIYHHFGLERAVDNIIHERRRKGIQDKNIKLLINVDGVPISKCRTNSFWLILCSEVNSETVYPIGAFYGTTKPLDANEFLNPFVQEAIIVCKEGVKNNNVSIEAIICDAPAKSFVLYLKGHTGYDCCSKCLIKGECHKPHVPKKGKKKKGRVCFPGTGPFLLKNDEDFKLNKYNNLESGIQTVLTELPGFGCVTSIPLDYMHLILLGVMKKLISLWVLGKSKVKIPSAAIKIISDRLLLLRNSIPDEFNRKPRSLWEFKFWKATEFRTFLLYAGVVVLKNVDGFPTNLYSHFLLLHTAVSILISERLICYPRNIKVAHEMLQLFVKNFGLLYGKEFISYNVHNLLHIFEDVERYGTVNNFSAFKFENYMSTVKKMIRKGDKPLQQLTRRYAEVEDIQKNRCSIEKIILEHSHNKGPLTLDCLLNIPEQYKIFETKGLAIKCDNMKNNCVLLNDGTFLIAENIVKYDAQDIWLIGHKLRFKSSLYNEPDSRLINIYMAQDDNEGEKYCIPLTSVISKVWKIPTSEGNVVIPLLHGRERK